MSDRILCERNNVRQWFTRRSWDLLGTNKLGWVEVQVEPPTPKEVVQPTRSGYVDTRESVAQADFEIKTDGSEPGEQFVYIDGRTLAEKQQPKTRKPRRK